MSDDLVPAGTRARTHVQYDKASCRPRRITGNRHRAPGVMVHMHIWHSLCAHCCAQHAYVLLGSGLTSRRRVVEVSVLNQSAVIVTAGQDTGRLFAVMVAATDSSNAFRLSLVTGILQLHRQDCKLLCYSCSLICIHAARPASLGLLLL